MNPVEHHADGVTPVVIEAGGDIVVLAGAELGEREIRVAALGFPGAPAAAAGDKEEVCIRHVSRELGAVLPVAFVDAILAGEEVAAVEIGAMELGRIADGGVHTGQEQLTLYGKWPPHRGELDVA